jgi:hypothetical protein
MSITTTAVFWGSMIILLREPVIGIVIVLLDIEIFLVRSYMPVGLIFQLVIVNAKLSKYQSLRESHLQVVGVSNNEYFIKSIFLRVNECVILYISSENTI